MHRPSVRRLLAGTAAAAVVALAVTTPAFAAAQATFGVSLTDTTVGVGAETTIRPVLSADRAVTVTGAAIIYELSGGLTGVSLVNPESGDCESTTPAKLVCSVPHEVEFGPDGLRGLLQAGLRASGDAAAGATGSVTATFFADGVAPVIRKAAVEVAESVELAAGPPREFDVKPGDTFSAALAVTNRGATVVRGAGVVGYSDYAIEAAKQFSNCTYRGQQVACLFSENLEPGTTYSVELPFRLRPDTAAPGTSAGYFEWRTAADFPKPESAKRSAAAGPELTLKKVSTVGALARQTDPNPDDNWQTVTANATGKQGTDIAAVGAKVSGAVGATVTATVGARNNGPATLDRNRLGSPATVLFLTVPQGTTVTTVPAGCVPVEGGTAARYRCYTSFLHKAGETITWAFGLRVDRVVADATGAIEVNPTCECDYFAEDLVESNDSASLVINPVGGVTPSAAPSASPSTRASARPSSSPSRSVSASPSRSPSGSPSPTAAGQGGGLPITGPETAAVAGVGVLLVAGGAALLLVTRQRRTSSEV